MMVRTCNVAVTDSEFPRTFTLALSSKSFIVEKCAQLRIEKSFMPVCSVCGHKQL